MDIRALVVKPDAPALAARAPATDLGLFRSAVENGAEHQRNQLRDLQARLAAENERSLLLVLQGMDASGKDGTIRRVFSGMNPLGCRVTSFKVPSEDEREHDYLWRVHRACPGRGEIGIFNRSHYEDAVTTRVLGIIDDATQRRRCKEIKQFEALLVAEGTTIVKVFLHISKREQRARLQARIDDPTKRWKFNLADLDTRKRWNDCHDSYDLVLRATSTAAAPWWIVPSDHKWVRDHVVTELLVRALRSIDPQYPAADGFDPSTFRVE